MEFGKYSKMTVSDVAKSAATEGGAVIVGLVGAGVLGKQIEKHVKVATSASSATDKFLAWAGNNVPKLGAYYLLRKEGGKMLHGYEVDMGKGVLGSVVLDTLVRLDNDYAPKPAVSLFGIEFLGTANATGSNVTPQMQENMQRVLQENSSLRQQLNGALQRIASANTSPAPIVTVTPIQAARPVQTAQPVYAPPPPDHDRKYGMMQTTPEAEERRKKFGAMTPPLEDERNKKYSSMKAQFNFAGDSQSTATAFGML